MKRRIYRVNRRKSFVYLLLFLTNVAIYQYALPPSADIQTLSEVETCPACYGHNLCSYIDSGQIQLSGNSRWTISDLFNEKNVYHATWAAKNTTIILKKLATTREIADFNDQVCGYSKTAGAGCSLQDGIARLGKILSNDNINHAADKKFSLNNLSAAKLRTTTAFSSTEMLKCADQNLIETITSSALQDASSPTIQNIVSILLVNQEPLVSVLFPRHQGWPFPAYLGACGRLAAFQYIGNSLNVFYKTSWLLRAYLSLQLLEMARKFSKNKSGLAIYPTDWEPSNFAVDLDRKVFLVDLEHVVIVNQTRVNQRRGPGWNVYHTADRFGCKNCFSFSAEDLCTHSQTDHNFHGVCGGLLSSNPYASGFKGGLLHSTPTNILARHPLLPGLIEDCKQSAKTGGREAAADLLMEILRSELEDIDITTLN